MTAPSPVRERLALWQRWAGMVGIAGVLLAAVGLVLDGWVEFLRSYLFAFCFWTGIGVGSLGILLLHHTVGGKWGMVIRRACEAGAKTLPFMFVGVIPILLNLPVLYEWARPEASHDEILQSKAAYLNVPFVVARTVVYFAIWTFYAWRLSRWSAEQDSSGDGRLIEKMRGLSAPGLVVFTFASTFAFVDWIMSLEPRWFSTMYGAMYVIGQVLAAFAFTIGLTIVLSDAEPLARTITKQHLHDLGNMMFAFMVLWAYLAFSQFIIIWSGNLPDEIPWYLRRLRGGWGWVALSLVVFHFAAPFVILLMRKVKRNAQRLLGVCVLLLVFRVVDVYWIVEPSFYGQKLVVHWLDFVTPAAVGGLWLAGFFYLLRSRPLVPVRDPRLEGAPRETVAF